MFERQRGQPLVLGAAWAAPPAMQQPALFEPPYSAMCHPAGRGDGSIADDVYALGVLLLTLALGRLPLAELDDAAILRRKLEVGSHGALVGDERLPPLVGDLLRGMLAEDPEHRPTPTLLTDPGVARSRRVAARPPRKAQRALPIGSIAVWDARTLAYAMAAEPEQAIGALRGGTAVSWLRRGLGESALATRVEDLVRHWLSESPSNESRSDAMMLMRVVAAIDPLAPLCWYGVAMWPDGLGPLLAVAAGEHRIGQQPRGSRRRGSHRQLGCAASRTLRLCRLAAGGAAESCLARNTRTRGRAAAPDLSAEPTAAVRQRIGDRSLDRAAG